LKQGRTFCGEELIFRDFVWNLVLAHLFVKVLKEQRRDLFDLPSQAVYAGVFYAALFVSGLGQKIHSQIKRIKQVDVEVD